MSSGVRSRLTQWNHHRKIRDIFIEIFSKKEVLAIMTIGPAVALFCFVNLVPIFWAIAASFNDIAALNPTWEWAGLSNYVNILTDAEFYHSLIRGIIFAVGSVTLQTIVGTGFALLLNRSFKFDKIARAIGLMPYLIPSAMIGFIALWMTDPRWGIINYLLKEVGIVATYPNWFGNPDLAMLSLIIVSSWKESSFVTILVIARLQAIPDGFYEAAKVSGASSFQTFRDITLPNLKNVLFIAILLRFVWMFNNFDIIWVLTRGGPRNATTTAVVYAYIEAFRFGSLGKGAAVSTILFGLLAVAAIVYFVKFNPSEEVRVE